MKIFLVAALLLSLVASIYSQSQAMCVANALASQVQDIASDCGNANLGDVRIVLPTYIYELTFFPRSWQVSATLTMGLASTVFQAFTKVAILMH